MTIAILLILFLIAAGAKIYAMILLHKISGLLLQEQQLLYTKKLKEIYLATTDLKLKTRIGRLLIAQKVLSLATLGIVVTLIIFWLK